MFGAEQMADCVTNELLLIANVMLVFPARIPPSACAASIQAVSHDIRRKHGGHVVPGVVYILVSLGDVLQ